MAKYEKTGNIAVVSTFDKMASLYEFSVFTAFGKLSQNDHLQVQPGRSNGMETTLEHWNIHSLDTVA